MQRDADRARLVGKWMRLAEADLGLARVPLPERGLYEYLCYHVQRAVEG